MLVLSNGVLLRSANWLHFLCTSVLWMLSFSIDKAFMSQRRGLYSKQTHIFRHTSNAPYTSCQTTGSERRQFCSEWESVDGHHWEELRKLVHFISYPWKKTQTNPCGGYICALACRLLWIYVALVWRYNACWVLIHSAKKS